jgi:HEAT repeat protein
LLGRGRQPRFRGNNAAVTGLMDMQFDRYRQIAGLNRHADTRDAAATGADEVATLIGQLASAPVELRISSAQRLAIFRDRAAAPALATCLRDRNRELRVAAAMALAACGTRESIEPLLAALPDRDPLTAQAAAIALENLTGRTQKFDAFAAVSQRRAEATAWAAWLHTYTWEAIERDLIDRLQTNDRDEVRRAAVALGHVGGDAARTALRTYVARERANNPYPEWRKDHQGDSATFNANSPANPRTLQEATRALGYLRDQDAVALLAETLVQHADPGAGNLFLAESAAEALGRIATPDAETALVGAFARLADYPNFTRWYGDHEALMACHASPVHYLITEALDTLGSTQATNLVPHLIRSVPTDVDRALFLPNDDCETLVGRVIRRSGAESAVVETCLAILGDPSATRSPDIEQAIAATHQAWGGKPDPRNRAAHMLSLVCRDANYEPRIRDAFNRYVVLANDIPRTFDTGIPVVTQLPVKHWVCFFLARTLGNLADPRSVDTLVATLDRSPTEAAPGRPDPLGPGALFLHNDLTPCWRAAVAWALGRIGDTRAAPVLLKTIADLDNAVDTRHAAAKALKEFADGRWREPIRALAMEYPEVSTRRVLLEALLRIDDNQQKLAPNGISAY